MDVPVAQFGLDQNPNVAMDAFGKTVVVYQEWNAATANWDVWGAQYNFGANMWNWGTVLWQPGVNETHPVVAVNRWTDNFVVAFQDDTNNVVWDTEFNNNGVFAGAWNLGQQRDQPAISIDGNGDYLLTYTFTAAGGTKIIDGVFGQVW
jgi:hypothetical protein